MKVAIYSESAADEAAIRILVEGLLGEPTERVFLPWLRSRGWPSILQNLSKVVQHLHYHTDAHALVAVVDSDRSPLPPQTQQELSDTKHESRISQLQRVVRVARSQLASLPHRQALKMALGLAVPTIEAWYRCGLDPQVNEATWIRALQSGDFPYDATRLKHHVYGTDIPALELATQIATQHARRLVEEQRLGQLQESFAIGFGALADDLRGW